MTPVTPRSLAAWELGDLSEISPSLIVRDEHDLVGRLILRLAVAFNDLKGMILLDQYRLAFAGTAANEISAHAGQSAGLLIQVHRFIGGIVNEALKVIDEERTAIDGAEVAELLASLPTPVQNFWRDIISEAQNSPQATNRTNRAMLARLRNKSAFHYDGTNLYEAFHHFFTDTPTVYNAKAYYSAGVDMDGTRYFFADAAAQRDYQNAGRERGLKTDAEVVALASKLNAAFASLINAFLAARAATSAVAKPLQTHATTTPTHVARHSQAPARAGGRPRGRGRSQRRR